MDAESRPIPITSPCTAVFKPSFPLSTFLERMPYERLPFSPNILVKLQAYGRDPYGSLAYL